MPYGWISVSPSGHKLLLMLYILVCHICMCIDTWVKDFSAPTYSISVFQINEEKKGGATFILCNSED